MHRGVEIGERFDELEHGRLMSKWKYLSSYGHASRDETTSLVIARGHHAKLLGGDEFAEILNLDLDGRVFRVLCSVGVGLLAAGVCV